MSVERYLARIGYSGDRRPNVSVLRDLHRGHLLSVPFENLDIRLFKPIVLDRNRFYHKIVEDGRGGYCYELNGCFSWLLESLGFQVSMLSARVASKDGRLSPEFDHMTLLVRLEERWLVDVGFGDSFSEPKQIDKAGAQKDDYHFYKIAPMRGRMLLSRTFNENVLWEPQYSFSLKSRMLSEFGSRNQWQQTSPKSHFTQGLLISQLTPNGRVTLTDRKLVLTQNRKRVERAVNNLAEFDKLLAKHFRIKLRRGRANSS